MPKMKTFGHFRGSNMLVAQFKLILSEPAWAELSFSLKLFIVACTVLELSYIMYTIAPRTRAGYTILKGQLEDEGSY